MYNGMSIYRAVVNTASSITGDVTVLVPSALGNTQTVPITKIGRQPLPSGAWNVPEVGDQVLVAVEDDRFTNVFLITPASADALEGLEIIGDLDLTGNLDVTGSATITGNTAIYGNTTVSGSVTALAFSGNGANITNVNHGSLTGLSNDHHTQYIRTDGTRAFTGPLSGDLTLSGSFSSSRLFVDAIEIDTTGATVSQALVFDGIKFVPTNVVGGGGGGGGGASVNVRYTAIVPAGSTTTSITHGLGSTDVMVEVYEISNGFTIYCGVRRTSSNTIDLLFDAAPSSNQYRVIVFSPPATVGGGGSGGGGGGGGGGSSRFEYQQSTPASQWSISHALNGYPLVNVTDSAGTQIFGDVTYPSTSLVLVNFSAPFTGVASLI